MPFAAIWMDLEIIILNEVNQTEKDKYVWYCLYVEAQKKKKDINELVSYTWRDSDIENKSVVTNGQNGMGGGIN